MKSIASLLLLCLALVVAEKDGDYYLPGFNNPNTKNEMYWKDSINVLQDLDQFDALYVTYHGCVWSKVSCCYALYKMLAHLFQYGTRYGSGQNYDEQGQGQPDDVRTLHYACSIHISIHPPISQ